MAKTTIVELLHDIYPYGCKGDVLGFSDEELKKLDDVAKKRGFDAAYTEVKDAKATSETPAPSSGTSQTNTSGNSTASKQK